MRISRNVLLCAAVAFVSVGCEVHDRGPDQGGVAVVADQPGGAVIAGGVAIDVEPDPGQRTYVYDEGYPPGTYLYDNYYYYNGYRYPHDVFVNQYVQANIRQHRFVNADDNRRQGQQIEQKQRTEFAAKNHGAREGQAAKPAAQPAERAPNRQEEVQRSNIEKSEQKAPANDERRAPAEQPEKRAPAKEEPNANERPENRTPAKEERPANGERPENKAKPEEEQHKPNADEPKKDDSK